jgi:dihydrofolate synthase / folylpolyglutamate synthase
MDYRAALAYLDRFINFETAAGPSAAAPAWDLDGFRLFLAELGNPERRFPSVLVAGTKGKGSVATLLAAALRAGGYRVGLYTSPHLSTPCERIAVDGRMISEEGLAERVSEIAPFLEGRAPAGPRYRTWFEIVTAAAFLHFRAARVEIAVLEVGLGGRLDATNVVEPLVSVVTSISLDHTKTLGETVGEIAREKAGILRTGVPVVTAPQPRDAQRAIASAARRLSAPLHASSRDFRWMEREVESSGGVLDFEGARALDAVRVGLPGRFQLENAAVTLKTLELLREAGFAVEEAALRASFECARWPGRFESFGADPVILLDGAHNPYSIEVLLESIDRIYPGRRLVVLFAASRDKDQRAMLAALFGRAAHVVITETPRTRNAPVGALLAVAEGLAPAPPREAIASPEDALARAREIAGPGDLILVTGSLYLVGAVREILSLRGLVAQGNDLARREGAVLTSVRPAGVGDRAGASPRLRAT